MRWKWPCVALLLGALTVTAGCYRPMHGLILRGDWSLELNRIPWINSRTVISDDQADSATATAVPIGTQSCSAPDAEGVSCGQGKHGRLICSAPWQSRPSATAAIMPAAGPQMVPPAEPSRFHPVPTGPVFHRSSHTAETQEAEASGADSVSEKARPEVIPLPAPLPPATSPQSGPGDASSGWKARETPSAGSDAASTPSWVFRVVPVKPGASRTAATDSAVTSRR